MSSDKQQHRGAHPEDRRLFADEWLATLQIATAELSWLLNRGYPITASLKLAGDRHRLNERQRMAIARAACSDERRAQRLASRVEELDVREAELIVDGFNLLITIEAALSQGVLLLCRDNCIRDLASVHGSYRSVQETDRALQLIGETLAALAPRSVRWLLDKPISNSGRLAAKIRELAEQHGWPWEVEVIFNPDSAIVAAQQIAVSSDAIVLDGSRHWFDLKSHLIQQHLPNAWLVDLRED
ncbi:MAG: DUF434 domain-containing protein [Chloroflexi bacterium]|nr:DUF434 domain-containing protein [Chloroflexota bacterium]